MAIGEAQAGLEAADPFVRPADAGQRDPAGHEHVGDKVDAVQVLCDREGAVRGGHGRAEVHLPEHLEAGQLAEQRGVPRVLAEVGELRGGSVDESKGGVEAEAPEHRIPEAPGDPRRARFDRRRPGGARSRLARSRSASSWMPAADAA